MKLLLFFALIIAVGAAALPGAAGLAASPQTDLGHDLGSGLDTDPATRTSYAVGHAVGVRALHGLSSDGMGVDPDLIAKGFADGLAGQEPMVDRREMRDIRTAVHHEMEARRVRRLLDASPEFKRLYGDNLARGRKFRELFAKQPGVVELPSGAQYLVVESGQGRTPLKNDTVVVKVRAQLLNRDVLNEGEAPLEMKVGGTIPGGVEILQLMSPGAKWQVVLPPELAYGEGGRYPDIGPNETLVATVELLEINRPGGSRR